MWGLAATTEARNQPRGRKKLCERGTASYGRPHGRPSFEAGYGRGGGWTTTTAAPGLPPQRSARQHDVGRLLRWDLLRHPKAKAWQVNA